MPTQGFAAAVEALAIAAAAHSLLGCTTTGSVQDLEAKVAAGWRPPKSYCAFGAETAALANWCAQVNFGGDGLLAVSLAVNREVLANAGNRSLACTDHVAQVRRRMAEYADYALSELYSCDAVPAMEDGRPVCHVSLLVTSASGERVVLDNGHVLERAPTGGVASYAEFARRVDRHWVGTPPALVATAARRNSGGSP